MQIQSFFVRGLSHISYIVGCQSKCAVIDPRRDVDIYIKTAEELGYTITHILETHLHADFISGHIELAEKTGAGIYAPAVAQCRFPHIGLAEGDEFWVENVRFRVMETPGHTPEHISFIVSDSVRGEDPCSLFCGDTLFVGDVGRPDLFPGRGEELSEKLFNSLKKIMSLPDFVEIYPAHSAGSLCGKSISAKGSSTLGYERKYNPALQYQSLEDFRTYLLNEMPPPPDHFKRCSATNALGPASIPSLPPVLPLSPSEFKKSMEKGGQVLDIRDSSAFGGQHIPGSIHIDIGSNFSTFAGWMLDVNQPLLLVSQCFEDVEKAVIELRRVGLDKIQGFLKGGIHAWATQGLEVEHIPQISIHQLRETCPGGARQILDVRSSKEFDLYHLDSAVNIPVPQLRTRFEEVKEPVFVICNSGHRSSLGASILRRHGIRDITNIPGGMTGWRSAGYTTQCPLVEYSHGPRLIPIGVRI